MTACVQSCHDATFLAGLQLFVLMMLKDILALSVRTVAIVNDGHTSTQLHRTTDRGMLTGRPECHNLGIVTLEPALLQGFWLQPLPHEGHMDLSCCLLAHQAVHVSLWHLTPLHHLPAVDTTSVMALLEKCSAGTHKRRHLLSLQVRGMTSCYCTHSECVCPMCHYMVNSEWILFGLGLQLFLQGSLSGIGCLQGQPT